MIFSPHEDNALDYVILREGGISLYRDRRHLDEDVTSLLGGYSVRTFDCATWHSEATMHANLSTALSFPDYYGNNLDALNEVVSELIIPDPGGLVVVLLAYDEFASRSFTLAEAVLDIFSRASHCFLLNGKRFLILVQSNDPKLTFPRLGGSAPGWNPREWLLRDRGL